MSAFGTKRTWSARSRLSALAAACLAILLYLSAGSQQAALVASLDSESQHVFVASVDVRRATVTVMPVAYRPDPVRVPELWLIPSGGKPLPLGVLIADRPTQIAIPPGFCRSGQAQAVLAVSLEPPGGSPTGQPTGPVIGSGKLTNL